MPLAAALQLRLRAYAVLSYWVLFSLPRSVEVFQCIIIALQEVLQLGIVYADTVLYPGVLSSFYEKTCWIPFGAEGVFSSTISYEICGFDGPQKRGEKARLKISQE